MRQLVLGDIHGAHKALLQVFERSKFDYEKDHLIVLGDVCDGWHEVSTCIEELMKVKNLIYLLGNHDDWVLRWMQTGWQDEIWTSQGGASTIQSYTVYDHLEIPKSHIEFLKNAAFYYVDEGYRLFVHGGLDMGYHGKIVPFEEQVKNSFLWDRELFKSAVRIQKCFDNSKRNDEKCKKDTPDNITEFSEIFLGHTTTQYWNDDHKPMHACEIWNLDTGAGWTGKLTLMDVNTKEYWQSDLVQTLYPNEKGRS